LPQALSDLAPEREREVELSDLVGICRAAFDQRPVEDVLGSVAEGTAELVHASCAAVVLIGYGDMLVLSCRDGERQPPRWHEEPAVAVDLGERLSAAADTVVLTAPPGPMADSCQVLFGCADEVITAFPFTDGGGGIGAVIVSGDRPYDTDDTWRAALLVIARQLELALRAGRLVDEHQDQMVGLARMVVGLRQQSRAHVGELLELQRSLAGATIEQTQALVADYHTPPAVRAWRLESPIVAGLVLGEMSVARERRIRFHISAHSTLEFVPGSLGDLGLVSVLSNLITNAFDAVESLPARRRRVSILVKQGRRSTMIRVRDWGVGLEAGAERDILRGGYSSKAPGRGTGLPLVHRLVSAAGGGLEIMRCDIGTRVTVTVPNE
jgi:Histidine kinase-, DNA gyrase B-, and HSP90-like ATPase